MLNRLRDQIGTAGLVVAIVALVAALGGGAYAASKGLNSTQKKEVKNIAKSFQGTGPAGAAGAPGPAGPKGDTGAAGAAGKDGVSVTSAAASVAECANGGTKFTSASGSGKVCNGKNGVDGQTGFTETLPEGMTETGGWLIDGVSPDNKGEALISFNIPLEADIPAANVHFEPEAGFTGPEATQCPGSAAAPDAEEGHLCVYRGQEETVETEPLFEIRKLTENDNGASTAGAVLFMLASQTTHMRGSWAVTAP